METEHVVRAHEERAVPNPHVVVVNLVHTLVDMVVRSEFSGNQVVYKTGAKRIHHLRVGNLESISLGHFLFPELSCLRSIAGIAGILDCSNSFNSIGFHRNVWHFEFESAMLPRLKRELIFQACFLESVEVVRHALGRAVWSEEHQMSALEQLRPFERPILQTRLKRLSVHELVGMPLRGSLRTQRALQRLSLALEPGIVIVGVDGGVDVSKVRAQCR